VKYRVAWTPSAQEHLASVWLSSPDRQAVTSAAAAIDADLIVLGSRGLGRIAGAFLGSTARAVAARSPVPVLVVRERREAPRRILVAVTGGIAAYKAPELVRALRRSGHSVRCVMTPEARQFVAPLVLETLCGSRVRSARPQESAQADSPTTLQSNFL